MKWQADFERRLETRDELGEVLIPSVFREKSLLLLNRPILKLSPCGLNYDYAFYGNEKSTNLIGQLW